jgi:hypothetical protein
METIQLPTAEATAEDLAQVYYRQPGHHLQASTPHLALVTPLILTLCFSRALAYCTGAFDQLIDVQGGFSGLWKARRRCCLWGGHGHLREDMVAHK